MGHTRGAYAYKAVWSGYVESAYTSVSVAATGYVLLFDKVESKGARFAKIGLAILCSTNSADAVIGFPVVLALFPEFAMYEFLLALPQSLLFNSTALVILNSVSPTAQAPSSVSSLGAYGRVIRTFLFLPVNATVIAALLFNAICRVLLKVPRFHYSFPFLDDVLTFVKSTFGATALFLVGLSMVGQIKQLRGRSILRPFALVFFKSILTPIVARYAIMVCVSSDDRQRDRAATFGVVSGAIPIAPSVLVFASQ